MPYEHVLEGQIARLIIQLDLNRIPEANLKEIQVLLENLSRNIFH